jgi:hypothetical protein
VNQVQCIPMPDRPWTSNGPRANLFGLEWGLEHNAAPPPASPVASNAPVETLTLTPYGCTNLRVAEFPVLA